MVDSQLGHIENLATVNTAIVIPRKNGVAVHLNSRHL
jgi:hypothetical protein